MTTLGVDHKPRGTFSPMTMISLIVVAVLAAGALSVLSAYAPQLRSGNDGGAHALSKSAVGFAAIAKLLPAIGRPVLTSRARIEQGSRYGLLVLTPPPGADAKDVNALRTGGVRVLIVLPKWNVAPSPTHRGWVRQLGPMPTESVEAGVLKFVSPDAQVERRSDGGPATLLRRTAPVRVTHHAPPRAAPSAPSQAGRNETWRTLSKSTLERLARADASAPRPAIPSAPLRTGRIEHLQTISGRNLEPVVTDERGRMVVAKFGGNPVYILADPDLLNTQGLGDPDTARTAVTLVDHLALGDGPVVFDVTLNGFSRSRNLLRLILEPPFLGGTLCLLAAAILAGVHAAVRFGAPKPPERAIAFGKRALADSTAGLIHIAGREHRMGGRYAAFARADAARAVGAPSSLTEAELDAVLDRLSDQQGLARFTALRDEARRASGLGELMAAARKIFQWRVEMTRERR